MLIITTYTHKKILVAVQEAASHIIVKDEFGRNGLY